MLRIRFKIGANSVGSRQRDGKEGKGLIDAIVGLGATESKKAPTGVSETLATQAGDPESVVGPFQ
mgnify:CR=1 FL=1